MTHSKTIAHISDLHISTEFKRLNIRKTEEILRKLIESGVSHIVVTGDITADATEGDFKLARSIFGSFGLLDPAKLTLVVGNHDIFGGVHTAEDVLNFPGRCRTAEYERKLEEFVDTFRETFEGCVHPLKPKIFPFAKALDGIVLVGLNSVARYSGVKNPIGSNGAVDEEQEIALKELLKSKLFENRRKIVLIHHHFEKAGAGGDGKMQSVWGRIEQQTMKLRGKKRLTKVFRKQEVEIVLHGHIHENKEYERGDVRFLNGGGTVLWDAQPNGAANLIHLPGRPARVEFLQFAAEILPARVPESLQGDEEQEMAAA